jgi:hypothetical protein
MQCGINTLYQWQPVMAADDWTIDVRLRRSRESTDAGFDILPGGDQHWFTKRRGIMMT